MGCSFPLLVYRMPVSNNQAPESTSLKPRQTSYLVQLDAFLNKEYEAVTSTAQRLYNLTRLFSQLNLSLCLGLQAHWHNSAL